MFELAMIFMIDGAELEDAVCPKNIVFCPLPFLLLLPYHPMHGKSFLCCPRKEKDTCISCFMLSVFGYLFATLSLYFYLSTCSTFVSHLLISSTMLEPHRWHLYVLFLTTRFTLHVLFNMLLFSPW